MTYSKAFASSLWQPFRAGSAIHTLIVDAASTRADFDRTPANWYSETGARYDAEKMASLWGMIEGQKRRCQALWMVAQGEARSMNAALAAIA